MVVLAAAVLTNPKGKILLSRQFVEMTRVRIEGLLSALPRLMTAGSQHTFIETESVRYLYQPFFENMLIVLVTNKGSNIVDDLSTLRMLGTILTEIVQPTYDMGQSARRTEAEVLDCVFEIAFAFDELLSVGYRNNTNPESILNVLKMESHDEAIEIGNIKMRTMDANKVAQQKAKEFAKMRREKQEGMHPVPVPVERVTTPTMEETQPAVIETRPPIRKPGKGMQMGGGPKKDLVAAVLKQEGIDSTAPSRPKPAPKEPVNLSKDELVIFNEKISFISDSEGNQVDGKSLVRGSIALHIPSKEYAQFQVQLDTTQLDRKLFDLRFNPAVDTELFEAEGILSQKRPAAVGSKVQLMKWSLQPRIVYEIPVQITVWAPNVSLELTDLSKEFINIVVKIPAGGCAAQIPDPDVCFYEEDTDCFVWTVDKLNGDVPSATTDIEWEVTPDMDQITVEMQSSTCYAGIEVKSVAPQEEA